MPSLASPTSSMPGSSGEQRPQPLARERLVVDDQHARLGSWPCVVHATRKAAVDDCGRRRAERESRSGREAAVPVGELEPVMPGRTDIRAARACSRGRRRAQRLQRARRAGRRRCRAPRSTARSPSRPRRRSARGRAPVRGAMPCLIAFSTSGCRIIRGTSASSASGSISTRAPSDDPGSASVRSRGTSGGTRAPPCSGTWRSPLRSKVMRSRSLSRLIIRSAASGSRCTSVEIACSVLNRKCGWSSASAS